ncbi:hypothetical protein C8J57DRAFT_1239691 [Mycena rebaudengoi]|nr:hypothetical protein C8J57DRAFT_1239691 [Mycena rebaudengoi]
MKAPSRKRPRSPRAPRECAVGAEPDQRAHRMKQRIQLWVHPGKFLGVLWNAPFILGLIDGASVRVVDEATERTVIVTVASLSNSIISISLCGPAGNRLRIYNCANPCATSPAVTVIEATQRANLFLGQEDKEKEPVTKGLPTPVGKGMQTWKETKFASSYKSDATECMDWARWRSQKSLYRGVPGLPSLSYTLVYFWIRIHQGKPSNIFYGILP